MRVRACVYGILLAQRIQSNSHDFPAERFPSTQKSFKDACTQEMLHIVGDSVCCDYFLVVVMSIGILYTSAYEGMKRIVYGTVVHMALITIPIKPSQWSCRF